VEPSIATGGALVEESRVIPSSSVEPSSSVDERSPGEQALVEGPPDGPLPALSQASEGAAATAVGPWPELERSVTAGDLATEKDSISAMVRAPEVESEKDGQDSAPNVQIADATIADSEVETGAVAAPVRSLRNLIESELVSLDRYHRLLLASGEAEAIHKMRVITRRLQAAIDLLEFKPDELKIKGLKKRLRAWRRTLSRVRNYDVFLKVVDKETLARRPG